MSFERRAARSRRLAASHSEAEVRLDLYAAAADVRASVAWDARTALDARRSGRDRTSPRSFFAPVLLQMGEPQPSRVGI